MREFWRNIRAILARQHDAFPVMFSRTDAQQNHVKVQRPPYDWNKEAPGGPRVVPPRPRKRR